MFRKNFALQVTKLYTPKDESDTGWTDLMINRFLKPLGKSLGYEVIREKGGRVDERWQRDGKDEVAIEHENDGEDIEYTMSDVRKLISLEAPLKVAITYVTEHKFDYYFRGWTKAILKELRYRHATWELLLILGGEWMVDFPSNWAGISFVPSYEARQLFYSSAAHKSKVATPLSWMRKELGN
jgi:hypothetical protein